MVFTELFDNNDLIVYIQPKDSGAGKVMVKFNLADDFSEKENAYVVGTYSNNIYFYILPCNLPLTPQQK